MKKDDELRKKLTDLLEDYEAEPEEKTWENIRAAIQPERRRKPWLPFFFGAALITASVGGWWWLLPENNSRGAARYVPHASEVVGHRFLAGRMYSGKPVRTALAHPERTAVVSVTATTLTKHTKNAPLGPNDIAALPLSASVTTKVNIPGIAPSNPETALYTPVFAASSPETPHFAPVKAISLLATTEMQLLPSRNNPPIMPPPAEALYRLRTPYRPLNYWMAGVQVLQTGQTMTALTYDERTATRIRQRRGVSPQRTGISVGMGYRRALRTRFDVGFSANWTNIPLETRYDVATLKEFDVSIKGNDQFEVTPRTEFTVDQIRRLNLAALNAETGYTFRLHRRYIRLGAGAGANFTLNSDEKPQLWWFTGLETPIGYSKYIFSVGYRRMQGQMLQPDQLLSTRLHTLEVGVKKKF